MPKLIIPESLQRFTDNESSCELSCSSLNELEKGLSDKLPKLSQVLFEEGRLHPFVRLCINEKIIEDASVSMDLKNEDEIELLVAVSGG